MWGSDRLPEKGGNGNGRGGRASVTARMCEQDLSQNEMIPQWRQLKSHPGEDWDLL